MSTTGDLSCENCGVGHEPDDIFCENCGYDFITGSLPGPNEQFPTGAPPVPTADPAGATPEDRFGGALFPNQPPSVAASPFGVQAPVAEQGVVPISVRVQITVDRAYFDAVVAEGELTFPEPVPDPVQVDLVGTELHVGRTSESRAIHPDIDVAALTGDPAVSSRHAVIRGGTDGSITVTDIGSTNGTYVDTFSGSGIGVGQPVVVPSGVEVYLGAWTRLTIAPVSSGTPPSPPMPR